MKKNILLLLTVGMLLLSSGCQPRAEAAPTSTPAAEKGGINVPMTYDGLKRKYKLYIPESYDKNTSTPLVVYLHGGGASNKAIYEDGLDKYSEIFGFILAAPNGTGKLPNKKLTWNGGTWSGGQCCGPSSEQNVDDIGFISAVIDDVEAKVNIDKRRVYVTGLSNGAMMTYRAACELADRIAAAAPVSAPAVPDGCAPARPISIMHIHGTSDTCTPYYGGPGGGCLFNTPPIFISQPAQEMVDTWTKLDNITSKPKTTYQKGAATCVTYAGDDDTEIVFCTIQGGIHTWVGGEPSLPGEPAVSYDISFEQIWEFFMRHPLP